MEYTYKFPAIRGIQAKSEYYTTMIPLKLLSKLFIFNEEFEETPSDFKAQRNLNMARVPEIGTYILNNPNTYVFSSLTASVDGKMQFESIDNKDIGYLHIDMESKFLINDGQHRKAAIEYAVSRNEELNDETISIVLFKDINLTRSQQMFADLNRHAVNPTRSIGILYDSRDELAKITKELVNKINVLKYYTDKESSSLSKFTSKAFTLSNIYSANERIVSEKTIDKEFIFEYWSEVFKNIKEFKLLEDKLTTAFEMRKSYIVTYGTLMEALGIIGNYYYITKKDFKKSLRELKKINWHRENEEWNMRVVGINGRIIKNSKAIKLTSNIIKIKLGIPLNKIELSLEEEFLKNGN